MDAGKLAELCRHPKVVGLGESGLDYYYGHSSRDNQRAAFAAHMEAARETGLPVVVHSRDADAETIELLSAQAAKGGLTGLIHCFTGTRRLAEQALELGFYISFSGIITFKNAEELRETAARVPLERMLVETDSPYLAPIPNRGKRNEPAFVVHTAALLAKLKGISPDELAKATTDNFFRLFSKASRPS
jgi:TatD DNase family protein